MRFVAFTRVGLAVALAAAMLGSAAAQSPGSVESELKYAKDYMTAGNWQYAQWRYEAVLQKDPDNAEALAGLATAKANYAALEAKRRAATQGAASGGTTTPPANTSAFKNGGPVLPPVTSGNKSGGPSAAQMATPRSTSGSSTSKPAQSKPVSAAQAECDRLFGSCYVTTKNPQCFVQRTMCYNRNGIK